jgi:glyoxylase-like metal-dependent hydrolase (beta-lactamase superfamily II)
MSSRRRFLQIASHAALSGPVLATLPLLSAQAADTSWVELGEGLALVLGFGGAVLVSQGSDGVALVDGGSSEHSAALLALVKDRTGQLPSLLFNTHCHRDQVGGNAALGQAGARIVAHENTKLWLGTEIISKWENKVYPPLPSEALPNSTFYYDEQTLTFNEGIRYGVLPQAHTDGDIYVFFPARNVLMAGDVASNQYPIVDYSTNGWIGGMINGLNKMIALCDDSTRIVTSTGSELRKAQLQEQVDMLYAMIDKIGAHYYAGGSLAEFIASKPSAEFDARWGDPALFLATAYESAWGHVGEARRFRR